MPDSCTCGTVLVERARFCHMCARPVSGTAFAETLEFSATPPPIPVVTHPPAPPVSFGNPIALRVAFIMSLAIMLMDMIPGVNLLFVVWWLGAGWCAVLLYRRLTGLALSVRAGARLGSITGVLTFLSMAVLSALTMAVMGKDIFQQAIRKNPQFSQVADDPLTLAAVLLLVLFIVFAMVVGTCAAGGALGARFAGRDGTNG